jgi:hypothetical protein
VPAVAGLHPEHGVIGELRHNSIPSLHADGGPGCPRPAIRVSSCLPLGGSIG